jgi:hypothetical protein
MTSPFQRRLANARVSWKAPARLLHDVIQSAWLNVLGLSGRSRVHWWGLGHAIDSFVVIPSISLRLELA